MGSLEVTNKDVSMEFKTPNLNSRDGSNVSKLIKGHIFGGEGYPAWFFGESDGTNVATAREMMRPTLWMIMGEVRRGTGFCVFIFSVGPQKASLNARFTQFGTVSLTEAVDGWELKFNNIYPKEFLVSTAAVKDITAVLIEAVSNSLCSIEKARKIWVDCLGDLDVDIDLKEMIAEIEAAEAEDDITGIFNLDDEPGVDLGTAGPGGLGFNELMRAAQHATIERKKKKKVYESNSHANGATN